MSTYLDRDGARDFLRNDLGVRIGDNALKDHASRETGPAYVLINGRALYKREDLIAWVQAQASRPVKRRKQAEQSSSAV